MRPVMGWAPLGLEPRTCGLRVPGPTCQRVPYRPVSREFSGRPYRIVQLVPASPGKFGTELGTGFSGVLSGLYIESCEGGADGGVAVSG